jgi:FAD/FMN-containing dehydrogenase
VDAILRHCVEHGVSVVPHGGLTGLMLGVALVATLRWIHG